MNPIIPCVPMTYDLMNHDTIKRLFPNASRSLLAANSDGAELSGLRADDKEAAPHAVRPELESDHQPRALPKGKGKEADSRRFLVRVTSIRRILLDEDNLCEKFVVDCCRYSGLLPSDRPGQTSIETRQRKAGKEEEERTVIEIFELTQDTAIDLAGNITSLTAEEIA